MLVCCEGDYWVYIERENIVDCGLDLKCRLDIKCCYFVCVCVVIVWCIKMILISKIGDMWNLKLCVFNRK